MIEFVVPVGHKVGPLCADGSSRYSAMANGVLLRTGTDSFLVATNGKALGILPVDCSVPTETMKPQQVPADACNANGKPAQVSIGGAEIRKTVGKKTEVFPLPAPEGRFPALQSVLGNVFGHMAVVLDADLLASLAHAISADGQVVLLIPPTKEGSVTNTGAIGVVGVRADGIPDGIGVIMPTAWSAKAPCPKAHYNHLAAQMPTNAINFAPTTPTE